jgi:hypothetical protein
MNAFGREASTVCLDDFERLWTPLGQDGSTSGERCPGEGAVRHHFLKGLLGAILEPSAGVDGVTGRRGP